MMTEEGMASGGFRWLPNLPQNLPKMFPDTTHQSNQISPISLALAESHLDVLRDTVSGVLRDTFLLHHSLALLLLLLLLGLEGEVL